eukprot:6468546-Amphidinium_carterae.1
MMCVEGPASNAQTDGHKRQVSEKRRAAGLLLCLQAKVALSPEGSQRPVCGRSAVADRPLPRHRGRRAASKKTLLVVVVWCMCGRA